MELGHVYILLNAAMPGYLKIGKTTNSPAERASQLSSVTSIPTPFVVAYSVLVSDCTRVESEIHTRLSKWRANRDREFFTAPLDEVIRELTELSKRFDPAQAQRAIHSANEDIGACPVCGERVVVLAYRYACVNSIEPLNRCRFKLARCILECVIDRRVAQTLMRERKTEILDFFVSISGRKFRAALAIDELGKVEFVFPEHAWR